MAIKIANIVTIDDLRALQNITDYGFPPDTNAYGTRYISTAAPSGGNDVDIWYKVY